VVVLKEIHGASPRQKVAAHEIAKGLPSSDFPCNGLD
jgi:hypothetical protein